MKWTVGSGTTAGATGQPGIGLCNNLPFAISGAAAGPVAIQNTNQSNEAIYNRVSRTLDTTNGTYNNLTGAAFTSATVAGTTLALQTAANLANEFRPSFNVTNNVMTWTDYGIIPLKYLCDVIDKMGLVKKCDLLIRAYFNTGAVQVAVTNPTLATCSYGQITTSFSQTCPITVNYLPGAGQYTALTSLITAGLYIGSAPSSFGAGTSITISGAASATQNPMKACRMYYSQVALSPQKALQYVEANTNKQVVFENLLFNQYSGITASSTFSQLVQSGIKNPIGIAIIPLISPINICGYGQTPTIGFSQYASPFDTFPATYSPLSLTNLQVTLGGVNVLNSSYFYTYENFLQQVQLAESLTSADIGISVGLINQNWWEQVGRVYWVDLARGTEADKATTRNLNISFTNNNNVVIDCMVFTCYLDRIVLNVENGMVKK